MSIAILKTHRREKLFTERPPYHWGGVIQKNLPHSDLLDEAEWQELLGHTRILYAEKRFEGCDGLDLTDEMKITVSAWGALLLLGRKTDYYPLLQSILIYPSAFIVPVKKIVADSVSLEQTEVRSGESHGTAGPGTLILAWDEVLRSAEDYSDGVNVALHEFAHQLDLEDQTLNGTPHLENEELRERWKNICAREFDHLVAQVEAGRDDMLIDPYGSTSPAEFFSVITEHFFEWPRDLRSEHPELYALLRDYYKQDPAQRWDAAEG